MLCRSLQGAGAVTGRGVDRGDDIADDIVSCRGQFNVDGVQGIVHEVAQFGEQTVQQPVQVVEQAIDLGDRR